MLDGRVGLERANPLHQLQAARAYPRKVVTPLDLRRPWTWLWLGASASSATLVVTSSSIWHLNRIAKIRPVAGSA